MKNNIEITRIRSSKHIYVMIESSNAIRPGESLLVGFMCESIDLKERGEHSLRKGGPVDGFFNVGL